MGARGPFHLEAAKDLLVVDEDEALALTKRPHEDFLGVLTHLIEPDSADRLGVANDHGGPQSALQTGHLKPSKDRATIRTKLVQPRSETPSRAYVGSWSRIMIKRGKWAGVPAGI